MLKHLVSVVLIEFSFSNKDETVSGCKEVVLQIVERQEANLKASPGSACVVTLQPREEMSLRRYTRLYKHTVFAASATSYIF